MAAEELGMSSGQERDSSVAGLERSCYQESSQDQEAHEDFTGTRKKGKFVNSRSDGGFPEPPGISASSGCSLWERYHEKTGSAPSLLGQCPCRWGRWQVCTMCVSPDSGNLCWQTSFAQDDAASSFLASPVVLSPGVAVSLRHRECSAYVTRLDEEETGEACVCCLWEAGWKIPGWAGIWCLWSAGSSVGSTRRQSNHKPAQTTMSTVLHAQPESCSSL